MTAIKNKLNSNTNTNFNSYVSLGVARTDSPIDYLQSII